MSVLGGLTFLWGQVTGKQKRNIVLGAQKVRNRLWPSGGTLADALRWDGRKGPLQECPLAEWQRIPAGELRCTGSEAGRSLVGGES